VAKALNYMLRRIDAFTRFLDDGRICLSNNAAERALRGIATMRSLCTPLSSVCKHCKLVLWHNATRAGCSRDRGAVMVRSEAQFVRRASTCSAGRCRSDWSRRMRWRETPSVVAASDMVSHSPFFSAER
jgi:hypothetical protein